MGTSALFLLLAACPTDAPDTQPADTETGGTETGGTETGGTPEQCPPADSAAVEDCVPQGDTEVCDNVIDDDCDGSANECGWSGVFSIDEVAHIIAAESEQDLAGSAVGAAGDVDCDGFDDFLVGAVHAGDMSLGPGAAYVMRGGPEIGDNLGQAWATIRGTVEYADFGNRLQGIGDVDGDGRGDIAVAGDSAHVFLDLQPGESFDTDASAVWSGVEPFQLTIGIFDGGTDLTGDGRLDLTLGANGGDSGNYFYANFICDAQLSGNVTTNDCSARIEGPDTMPVPAGTGDFDGDGQADLLVRDPTYCPDCPSPTEGWRGAALGMYGPILGDRSWDDPGFLWSGELDDRAGYAATVLGDTNADGYDDVAVSSTDWGAATGGVPSGINVVLGPFSGARSLLEADAFLPGTSMDCLTGSDIDGDGRADILWPAGQSIDPAGASVAIQYGPFNGTTDEASFDATFVATVASETDTQTGFDNNFAAAGDVNADGHGDLLFGDRYAGLSWSSSSIDYNDGQTYLLLGKGR